MKKVKFDSIGKIQKTKNKSIFKTYLEKVFDSHSIIICNEKIITEYTFYRLLRLSHYISNKILKILIPSFKINKYNFIYALNILYNGTLRELQTLVFKILDYDNDGFIVPEEVRIVLHLIIPEADDNELKEIISKFFEGKPDTMSLNNYYEILEKFNSDVFYTIINYIYYNACFDENNIELLQSYEVKTDRDVRVFSSSKIEEERLALPTKGLERILTMVKEDKDLEELEQLETDIKLIKFKVKTILHLESPTIELRSAKTSRISNNNKEIYNNLISSDYDYEDYVYIKSDYNDIELKKYWGVILNMNFVIYENSSSRSNMLFYYQLTNKFVMKNTGKEFFFDKSYFYFEIGNNGVFKKFYSENSTKALKWIDKLRESIKQREFTDYYKLIKFIGEGYFAKVYQAENIRNKDIVAVKIFQKQGKTDEEFFEIKEETEIIKYCMHENIIRYIDDFEDDKNIYVVQEYMNHLDLFNFVNEYDLDETDIESIIKQIFSGLNYLRKNNILHRDIKLTNILVDIKKSLSVKISDFGLAKILRSNEYRTDRVGMVLFSAPEMLLGKRYSYNADIWSAGIVIYYLLFEKLPFDNELDNEEVVYKNLINKDYKMLSNDLDYRHYKKLLFGCLEWDPEKRLKIETIIMNWDKILSK